MKAIAGVEILVALIGIVTLMITVPQYVYTYGVPPLSDVHRLYASISDLRQADMVGRYVYYSGEGTEVNVFLDVVGATLVLSNPSYIEVPIGMQDTNTLSLCPGGVCRVESNLTPFDNTVISGIGILSIRREAGGVDIAWYPG